MTAVAWTWFALGTCALGCACFIAAGVVAYKAFGGARR